GTLTITGSTITDNAAPYGNGGGVSNYGPLTITGGSVSNNTAFYGGGMSIASIADNGQIVNVLFARNAASQGGAALPLASRASLVIWHSTITSPFPGSGAAIVVTTGTVGITDTIIANYTTGILQAAGSVYQDYNLFFSSFTDLSGAVSGGVHTLRGAPAFV